MAYALIFIATLISCYLFDRSGVPASAGQLKGSYQEQFRIMQDPGVADDQKQALLLRQTKRQLKLLALLVLGLLLFLLPFGILLWAAPYIDFFEAPLLYHWTGLAVSFLAVGLYLLARKKYGHLF